LQCDFLDVRHHSVVGLDCAVDVVDVGHDIRGHVLDFFGIYEYLVEAGEVVHGFFVVAFHVLVGLVDAVAGQVYALGDFDHHIRAGIAAARAAVEPPLGFGQFFQGYVGFFDGFGGGLYPAHRHGGVGADEVIQPQFVVEGVEEVLQMLAVLGGDGGLPRHVHLRVDVEYAVGVGSRCLSCSLRRS
jgi:hypothetical protein